MVFNRDAHETEGRRPVGYLPENHRFPTYLQARHAGFLRRAFRDECVVQRKRIPELLNLVGLDERAHNLRLGKYSGMLAARHGLAQALIHSPKLLVLDEPGDVDPVGHQTYPRRFTGSGAAGSDIPVNSHLLGEVELFCREVAIIQG